MNSDWTRCRVNGATVPFWGGMRWEMGEMCFDCENTQQQIYLHSSLICSHSLIPSVTSSDRMHIRVCASSICLCVCVCSSCLIKKKTEADSLCPLWNTGESRWGVENLNGGESLNIILTWHRTNNREATRPALHAVAFDRTRAMLDAFQLPLSLRFKLFVLIWKFRFRFELSHGRLMRWFLTFWH